MYSLISLSNAATHNLVTLPRRKVGVERKVGVGKGSWSWLRSLL